jgi:SSU ribosomal protein S4P
MQTLSPRRTDLQLKSGVKPFDVKTKKHAKAPGQHGQSRAKQSEYSLQLRENKKYVACTVC